MYLGLLQSMDFTKSLMVSPDSLIFIYIPFTPHSCSLSDGQYCYEKHFIPYNSWKPLNLFGFSVEGSGSKIYIHISNSILTKILKLNCSH